METRDLPVDGAGDASGHGDDTLLDRLLADCVERFETEGPEAIWAIGAIEAICSAHPELAGALRRRLEFLESAGLLVMEPTEGQSFPERLGDFRLIAPLGGGGMGLVYRAHQESLEREVALKLIRPEQLYFPGSRERFQREVLTVAQLHHPGIVPVYSVGEENGVPYFAMERVHGCTLAEVLGALAGREPAGLSGADFERAIAEVTGDEEESASELFRGSWVDTCLRILREICDALEHAHRRDVLHRDLKPSNIMITRGGRVLLLDFGLASRQGSDRLTRSGSQVGSLPYLAPDYLSGENPEPSRSHDVYSLGVTLYELLGLRLPFPGPGTVLIQSQILQARPKPLRQLNPECSWETVTVCEAAMDPDPGRRYATAADLARDLTNVLERRPIDAQRAGPALRARRWAQRHPATAVGVLLGSLLLGGGPTAYAVVQGRHSARVSGINDQLSRSLAAEHEARGAAESANEELERALSEVEAQRNEADAQAARAETNFDQAMGAVERMLHRVGSHELADVPEMMPVRGALMDDATSFYRELARENEANPELRSRLADALLRLAALTGAQQQYAKSEASVRAQIEIDRALVEEDPSRARSLARQAQGLALLGQLHALQDQVPEALESTGQAVELMQSAVQGGAGAELQLALARGLDSHASLLYRSGEVELAYLQYQRVVEVCASLPHEDAASWEARYVLSTALNGAGGLAWEMGQIDEAEGALRESVAIRDELMAEGSGAQVELSQVNSLSNLANLIVEARAEDPDSLREAEQLLRRALEIQERMVAHTPSYLPLRNATHDMQESLASLLGRSPERLAEARELAQAAVAGQEALVANEPDLSEYHSDLANALATLGRLLARDDPEQGRALLERAIAEQSLATTLDPRTAHYRRQLVAHHLELARLHLETGRHAAAGDQVSRCLESEATEPRALREAVQRLAECAQAALRDASLEPEQRTQAMERYARLASVAVHTGIDAGSFARSDFGAPQFDVLRRSATFQSALEGDE